MPAATSRTIVRQAAWWWCNAAGCVACGLTHRLVANERGRRVAVSRYACSTRDAGSQEREREEQAEAAQMNEGVSRASGASSPETGRKWRK